jgi:hypothetical protein
MKQSQFYYLLRRGLFSAGSAIIKNGLVMFNKFTTAGLNFPAQGSAEFNGTSDYIEVKEDGKGSDFAVQEFTIGAWVYLDSAANDKAIWSFDFTSHTPPYYAQQLRINTSYNLQFFWNNGSANRQLASSINAVTLNNWYYVTATYKSGEQKLYLDGSLLTSSTLSETITYYNQEVWIGRSNYAYMNGNLANVAFWNRALSSDEINSVMWKSYEGLTGAESNGLQAWYSLDDITSPAASLANMEQLATDKDATIENKAAITAAINALS